MYLSQVDLHHQALPPPMQKKLNDNPAYALHQWLWQLFSDQPSRSFLFHQQTTDWGTRCYLLSAHLPARHNLLQVASKPFAPRLTPGDRLCFALRINPVITRYKKRFDIMTDIRYHAPKTLSEQHIRQRQQQAVLDWLSRQAVNKGFSFHPQQITLHNYQQHNLIKYQKPTPAHIQSDQNDQNAPHSPPDRHPVNIRFNSIDLQGLLTVNDPACFLAALASGFGKSRALGCGLMLIKRA